MHRRRRNRPGSVAELALTSYLGLGLGLLTAPVIARTLGPAGRGEVAAVTTYAGLMATLLALGMPVALGHAAGTRKMTVGQARRLARTWALIVVAPTALLTAAVLGGPLAGLGGDVRWMAAALLLATPISVAAYCWQGLLLAEGALRPLAVLRLLPLAGVAVVVLLLAALERLTVATLLAASLALALLTAGVTLAYVRDPPSNRVPLLPTLRYGLRAAVGTFANTLNSRLDQAVLAAVVEPASLGLYAVAVTISSLPMALGQAFGSRTFAQVAGSEGDARGHVSGFQLRRALLVSSVAALVIALSAPWGIPLLFGAHFAGAVPPTLVLLAATPSLAATAVLAASLNAVGLPGRSSQGEALALVVTAVLLPFAVSVGDLYLIALVSVVAHTASAFWHYLALRKVLTLDPVPRFADLRSLGIAAFEASRTTFAGRLRRPSSSSSGSDHP